MWFRPDPKGNITNRSSYEQNIILNLLQKFPAVDLYKQKFFPGFINWLPFFWNGFEQTTKYTYVLPDISNPDSLFAAFKSNTRRVIRNAQKLLKTQEFDDVQKFYDLNIKAYQGKGMRFPFTADFIGRVKQYIRDNNCGDMIAAVDAIGNIHAVVIYVWDSHCAYYLAGVTNPNFYNSGAMSLLLWEAIQRSAKKSTSFNFEGSMAESIERFFRDFGGRLTPYFEISKTQSRLLKWIDFIRGQ